MMILDFKGRVINVKDILSMVIGFFIRNIHTLCLLTGMLFIIYSMFILGDYYGFLTAGISLIVMGWLINKNL
ncbi:hypothetical protein [Carnobacterium maltaromaticum]|uniref:hypothetical protein n=1 Tax=Carnobacterium maltaromaticum TaxID=2751 RepID=UPI0012F8F2BA|nr:hypothetical protein [Carnobacterium maltaromaticum]